MTQLPETNPSKPEKARPRVPLALMKTLGDTCYRQCEICGSYFEGPWGCQNWCPNPKHADYPTWFPPPRKLKRSDFALICVRLGFYAKPSEAKRLLDIDITEYDRYDYVEVYVPEDLARKVLALDSRPVCVPVNGPVAVNGPNTKYSVVTPDGEYPTLNAAAEAYGVSYQTAYKRAHEGLVGWSKRLLKGGSMGV